MLSNVRTYFNCSLFCKNGEFQNCKYKILKVVNTIYTYAPIYTNFEGDRAPKKNAIFWSNISKLRKNGIFGLFFFQKYACDAKCKILFKSETL